MLGAVLLEQKKYAEAEPLLTNGYTGMQSRENQIPAKDKSFLIDACDRLIRLFTETNQPEKLKKWQMVKEKVEKVKL